MKVKLLSRVQLLATPWTTAYQAPPSMGFSRQEYWSGVPLPWHKLPKFQEMTLKKWEQTSFGTEDELYLKHSRWSWSDHRWPISRWLLELTALFLPVNPSSAYKSSWPLIVSRENQPLNTSVSVPPLLPASGIKQTFFSTNLAYQVLAFEGWAARSHFQYYFCIMAFFPQAPALGRAPLTFQVNFTF